MDLLKASAAARMDPFAKYTGAMAKRKTLTGRDYWLVWVNEEWDPIVRRWFPPANDADGLVTPDVCNAKEDGAPDGHYKMPDWQPVTDNISEPFRQFLDHWIINLTFRIT